MHISTTKVLALMADQPESLILFELGAAHRDDLKGLCVTVRFPDGRELPIPSVMLDDLIRQGFVYEAVPLDAKFRRVYRLTEDGLRRGRARAELVD